MPAAPHGPEAGEAGLDLRDDPCPACGARAPRFIGRPRPRRHPRLEPLRERLQDVRTARCTACGCLYLSPMVHFSVALQRELYNIGYFSSDGVVEADKNLGEKEQFLDLVERFAGPLQGKRFLDVGCGTGEFLAVAARRGMDVTGTDVDESMRRYIGERHGFPVVAGTFDERMFPAESFDVIALSHVIEHLDSPADHLRAIHRMLKPGGHFLMCTPNFDSVGELVRDLVGKVKHGWGTASFLELDMPLHIVGFNARSARAILERTGFEPLLVKPFSGLNWANSRSSVGMLAVTLAGAALGRGLALNTVSRKRVPPSVA